MATEPGIHFDYDKFEAAVHFVCAQFSDRPDVLGQIKLHKILYFADMFAYLDTGEPITGVEYQKQRLGPTARYLGKALRALDERGAVKVSKRKLFGYEKTEFQVLKPWSGNILSADEQGLLKAIADWVSGFTAMEISEYSHQSPWVSVKLGERIDYASAGLLDVRRTVGASDIKWAEDEARRLNAGEARVRN